MLFLNINDSGFDQKFAAILARGEESGREVELVVLDIIADVRTRGDEAVLELSRRFDRVRAESVADLEVTAAEIEAAFALVSADDIDALRLAVTRVTRFHEKQKQQTWISTEEPDIMLGQKVTPLSRVGIYVPGGKASYPSSVIMNAVPARVAGVGEIIMVAPSPGGEISPSVLVAATLSGVDRIFRIGGAQAVAALAYGTATIPRVDKITGPGNIYVATAKKLVFGQVGIDMIAGPSEILIICDGKTNPDWIAMDLFSQAEHDEDAQAILISDDAAYLEAVEASINALLPTMERAEIIRTSLTNRGALILVKDLEQAAEVANIIAPEHLELSVENPESLCEHIRHAGAIFMGRYTAEALGDYCAGPNHVLPTSSTARFSSPLGVYDFQKRSSLINCSADGANMLGKIASTLARGESLTAHARSAEYRLK